MKKKNRLAEILPYFRKKYFVGRPRWIILDDDKEPVYCKDCLNYANGVIIFHGVFNVPYCKVCYSENYFKNHPEIKEINLPSVVEY